MQHATSAADHIELSESSGHVYTNPNYPTLEIGGMPFYLMPASPVPRPGLMAGNSNNFNPGDQSNSKSSSQSTTGFYEPSGGSTLSQRSNGGPIYEDIDRMCTYRGSPPNNHNFGGKIQKEERTYYNVPHSQQPRSDSGEGDSSRDAAHNFCGTRYVIRI